MRWSRLGMCIVLMMVVLVAGCGGNAVNVGTPNQIEGRSAQPAGTEQQLPVNEPASQSSALPEKPGIIETGEYSKPQEVAEYIHLYRKLPANYITKQQAIARGWVSSQGNLWEVTERKSIGGDKFGNFEGGLPKAKGRQWYECDVNYQGGFRGGERILYSNDGLIYYSADHYKTFTRIY